MAAVARGAALRHATEHWQPLWLRPDAPAPDEAIWLQELSELPPLAAPAEITDEEVIAAFKTLPLGKAPGLDDWVGDELRRWPAAAVRGVAALLRCVERVGRWPAGLARAEVVLLPKGDADVADSPLQRRPITLLPILYRLWAVLRQGHVAAWRRRWDPACALARLGAEGQAWMLSWEADLVRARGLALAGVAVD